MILTLSLALCLSSLNAQTLQPPQVRPQQQVSGEKVQQIPQETSQEPQVARASAVAAVSFEDGRLRVTSPWRPLMQGDSEPPSLIAMRSASRKISGARSIRTRAVKTAATPFFAGFDGYEATSSSNLGPPGEHYTPNLGLNDTRYWFGSDYNNPFFCKELRVARGQEGRKAKLVNLNWAWNTKASAPSQQTCYVVVYTTDDFGYTTLGPPFKNSFGGVMFRYDNLSKGIWYANENLTPTTLGIQLPLDGMGGYGVIFMKQASPSFIMADNAQPMLWFQKEGNPSYYQHCVQWDDDHPTDGVLTPPWEWYNYGYSLGRGLYDPLAGVLGLYTSSAPTSWMDWPLQHGQTWRVALTGGYTSVAHRAADTLFAVDFMIDGDDNDGSATKRKEALAAAAGTVTKSTFMTGLSIWGHRIEITHTNGFRTTYSHLDERKVKKGDKVKKGQLIGYIGKSGLVYNNHLHFELRRASDGAIRKPEPIAGVVGLYAGYAFYRP